MGKIRVKNLGDEELERQQQEEARRKAEAKRAAEKKASEASDEEENTEETDKKQKKEKFASTKKDKHSQNYKAVSSKVDKNKTYSLKDALELLSELKRAKFDETVELHINTTERGVSGSVTLPHGTGKQIRIAIANATKDPNGVDELVQKIESGVIDFDVLIATPDSMPKLARVAKVLGPRGLMPNPKNNTVSPKPEAVAKQFEAGQISFKTEAKAPIIHAAVGKVSFGSEKLQENIKSFMGAVPNDKVKNVTLKSTMSPGIRVNIS